jgi:hypothetical protein
MFITHNFLIESSLSIMSLSRGGVFGWLYSHSIRVLVISVVFLSCLNTAEAQQRQGNWFFYDSGRFSWFSSENPSVPASGTLTTDITARLRPSTVKDVIRYGSSSSLNFLTFGAGESIMLPLCVTGVYSSTINKDASQDNKISFEASSTFTVFMINGSTGNLSFIVPTIQTSSITVNVTVLFGYLKFTFPIDVYAHDFTIIIVLTKLKLASGLVCGSASYSGFGIRAGSNEPSQLSSFQSVGNLIGSAVAEPRVFTADFSDSRPSRATNIRISSSSIRSFTNVMSCSSDSTNPNSLFTLQLPLYLGIGFNVSALSISIFGSPDDPSQSYTPFEAYATNLAFDRTTFELSFSMIRKEAFVPCVAPYYYSAFYIDISGVSTPPIPARQNLQLGIRLTSSSQYLPLLFPDVETISGARITVGVSTSTATQFLVSFLTSFDVNGICGPGDSSNMKQRIILHIHDSTQITQTLCNSAKATAKFLSIPNNSPLQIGSVVADYASGICAISLYLSSGDSSAAGCTSRSLLAPILPSTPIILSIDGLTPPNSPLPQLPVSILIDEASPKGITQSCSKCAEWPSTPAFSASVELSDESYSGFTSLLTTLNGIDNIAPGDTLTIQVPHGISYDTYSSSSAVVCAGGLQRDLTTDNAKFDVLSYYPNLVLKWKTSNSVISSASIYVKCSWISSNSGTSYWRSSFDSAPVFDLKIKKESASGSVRQSATGSSPGRRFFSSLDVSLADTRPGYSTFLIIRASRGSFGSRIIIPASGFRLSTSSNGQAIVAKCSCVPAASSSVSSYSNRFLTFCTSGARSDADVAIAGDLLKVTFATTSKFNYCNLTVDSRDASGPQSAKIAYIDNYADLSYSAPKVSSISSASVAISSTSLNALTQATISFAHTTLLVANSVVRVSGFCNFVSSGSLTVSFISGTATASIGSCDLVILIVSGTLTPPPSGSLVQFTIGNLKTPSARQPRSVVSISTHSSSSSAAAVIDVCNDCAFISEMPAFESSILLSSTAPAATSVEISILMKNVWDSFVPGSTIELKSDGSDSFPGAWTGPANVKISVNGDLCDATVSLSGSGLLITHKGSTAYSSLDISIKLGPHYTVPRKMLNAFSIQVNKGSSSNSVSSVALYPEISGNCPAGHSLNSTSKLCQRCAMFRFNDGTMSECRTCSGQGLGNLGEKATTCLPFCQWPFEYNYERHSFYENRCRGRDGGLCSKFEFENGNIVDVECSCNEVSFYDQGQSQSLTAYYSHCSFFNLNINFAAVAIACSIFVFIFIVCVLRLPSKAESTFGQRLNMKSTLTFLALFPTLDFISDIFYILTSKFYTVEVFAASVFFFVLPM